MSEDVVTRAREMLAQATPGPWLWHGYDSPQGEGPVLITRRWGMVYVMSFRRRGLQGAKPEFWRSDRDGEHEEVLKGWGGSVDPEPWIAAKHNGRVVEAKNADARLIAAAPELIAGLLDEIDLLRAVLGGADEVRP